MPKNCSLMDSLKSGLRVAVTFIASSGSVLTEAATRMFAVKKMFQYLGALCDQAWMEDETLLIMIETFSFAVTLYPLLARVSRVWKYVNGDKDKSRSQYRPEEFDDRCEQAALWSMKWIGGGFGILYAVLSAYLGAWAIVEWTFGESQADSASGFNWYMFSSAILPFMFFNVKESVKSMGHLIKACRQDHDAHIKIETEQTRRRKAKYQAIGLGVSAAALQIMLYGFLLENAIDKISDYKIPLSSSANVAFAWVVGVFSGLAFSGAKLIRLHEYFIGEGVFEEDYSVPDRCRIIRKLLALPYIPILTLAYYISMVNVEEKLFGCRMDGWRAFVTGPINLLFSAIAAYTEKIFYVDAGIELEIANCPSCQDDPVSNGNDSVTLNTWRFLGYGTFFYQPQQTADETVNPEQSNEQNESEQSPMLTGLIYQ